jgi:hypothetical protein
MPGSASFVSSESPSITRRTTFVPANQPRASIASRRTSGLESVRACRISSLAVEFSYRKPRAWAAILRRNGDGYSKQFSRARTDGRYPMSPKSFAASAIMRSFSSWSKPISRRPHEDLLSTRLNSQQALARISTSLCLPWAKRCKSPSVLTFSCTKVRESFLAAARFLRSRTPSAS